MDDFGCLPKEFPGREAALRLNPSCRRALLRRALRIPRGLVDDSLRNSLVGTVFCASRACLRTLVWMTRWCALVVAPGLCALLGDSCHALVGCCVPTTRVATELKGCAGRGGSVYPTAPMCLPGHCPSSSIVLRAWACQVKSSGQLHPRGCSCCAHRVSTLLVR